MAILLMRVSRVFCLLRRPHRIFVRRNFSDYDLFWNDNYEKLKHYAPLKQLPQEPELRDFIRKTRRNYKLQSKDLTNERIELLQKIGLRMDPRKDHWERRYQELIQFHRTYGCFPYDREQELKRDEKRLFYWCQQEKKAYRRLEDNEDSHLLIDNRIERLEKIGFSWNVKEDNWMSRYEDLKEYRRVHGDCLVPMNYPENPKLAKWVGDQRYGYKLVKEKKSSPLTESRIELLESIGFDWNAQDAIWMKKYEELREHFRVNGAGNLAGLTGPLKNWARHQRQAYKAHIQGKKTPLSPKRKRLLDKIGFYV